MQRLAIGISALAAAALVAVALAAPPFETGNNPAQDCKDDAGPPTGRAFGECVSTKARALDPAESSASRAAEARRAKGQARAAAARAKAPGESQRKAPFAKGDNPAQHCKNESGPPTGRDFGECVAERARSLNPSAGRPENAGQGPQNGKRHGPPAERPEPAPRAAPPVGGRQGPPSDTPAGPPAGLPQPRGGGPPGGP